MIKTDKKETCCGCGNCTLICPHHAISMKADDEGFSYPHISEESCVQCGLCDMVCPIKRYDNKTGGHDTTAIFAAKNKDNCLRMSSSSGGVFSAISNWMFSHNGVVCGCTYTDKMEVEHTIIRDESRLSALRGAKYVQSSLNKIFMDIKAELEKGHKVLFTGTPCQVEALRGFLRKPYPSLVTCDLLCYGVPSQLLFAKHIEFIQHTKKKTIININIRNKSRGWGKLNPSITYSNGSTYYGGQYGWLWQNIYSSHLAHRPSCYACRYTNFHRSGDISIGDYWGIERYHPEFADNQGVSLILVNTIQGNTILEELKSYLEIIKIDKSECLQQCLEKPVNKPANRRMFWKDLKTLPFYEICVKYLGWNIKNRIIHRLHGTLI